jgi:hypothetical protein
LNNNSSNDNDNPDNSTVNSDIDNSKDTEANNNNKDNIITNNKEDSELPDTDEADSLAQNPDSVINPDSSLKYKDQQLAKELFDYNNENIYFRFILLAVRRNTVINRIP